MDWTPTTLVRVDDDYDRANADRDSALSSRYGVYLTKNLNILWEEERTDPAAFASWAWSVATGPIMSPGYIRIRPDLQNVQVSRSDYDGTLYVTVGVPVRPDSLVDRARPPWTVRSWENDSDSWESGDYRSLVAPRDSSSDPKSTLLVSAELRVPATGWALHQPGDWTQFKELLVDDAKVAVDRLVQLINTHIGPKVAALVGDEGGTW